MQLKPNYNEILWMTTGAVIAIVAMLITFHFRKEQNVLEQLVHKTERVNLVAKMRYLLASASEAEKSAVMAITDQDSQNFANQARSATTEIEQKRKELADLLATGSLLQNGRELLSEFSKVFTDFQRIDDNLLVLAVKNTNLKAYNLAFGPAADAVSKMDTAFSHMITLSENFPSARNISALVFGILKSALRIQTLLAPHIAEESDKKMDELEALMKKEDLEIRKNIDTLTALKELNGSPDLKTATDEYSKFSKLREQILALSRENTNVRSLAISLDQKRKVMFLCQSSLEALQKAIQEEPIGNQTDGLVPNPRSLQLKGQEPGN
ncbi:MAG: hypothetical protein HQM08_11460 [Candidatus Riflebacteria bacterium]|nr:hypothetical protein [Candidatus Riflebacteria bacterium]